MSEAPERIIAKINYDGEFDGAFVDANYPLPPSMDDGATEYVRADLAPQWRPISEAPEGKDLLVCVTHSIGLDEWETVQWVDCFTDLYGWRHFPHLIWVPFPPTHFMPLPEAPNE